MEEDDLAGKLDFKLRSRLSNPNFDETPSIEHDFLACGTNKALSQCLGVQSHWRQSPCLFETVANESDFRAKGLVGVQRVEVNSNNVEEHCSVDVATELLSNSPEGCSSGPLLGDDALTDAAAELNCQANKDICAHGSSILASSPGGPVPEAGCTRSPLTESPTNSGPVGSMISSPVPRIEDRSRSSLDVTADLCAEDQTFRSKNMEEADSAVALHADYVFYRDNYYPTALVTISAYSIKIESLDMDKDEALVFEWAIGEDVVSIQSQWYARGSLVKVHIHLSANSMVPMENLHNASGVEELKVMLIDPAWMLSLEKIFSLNLRYKTVWQNHAFSQIADSGDALPIQKTELSLGPYFPNFDGHFEDVIYPEGDADPVSIGKRDIDLLRPETFINDTIIDFYIKYLKSKIPTGELNRFHFFNSFFFRKLADLDKNPDSVFDGKAAFQRVRKWTRKLSLFEKDYIFIPVNYNYHWSLIVICHPGRVASFAGEKMNLPSRVPCILHMDSIRGSHSGLKNLIQSYLLEEWKERQKETSEDISSKFLNLRFLSLELPQQQNYYDCGLFLLHYVELFLEDAPDNFNPLSITKFSTFLTANWFIPSDVSLKRTHIQRLIHGILAKRSEGVSGNFIGGEDDECQPFKLEEDNGGNVNGIELISVSCNPQDTFTVGSVNSVPEKGFCINLQRGLPAKSSHCPSQPASALRDLFEPGTSLGSLGKQYGGPRSSMLPAEEEDEDFESPLYSTLNGTNLRPLDGLPYGGCKETIEGDNGDFKSPLYPLQTVSRSRRLDGLKSGGCSMEVFSPSSCSHNLDIREHDLEDDSSPDSDHSSDDEEEVQVMEEDSESTDSLFAQDEKLDVTNCSFEEKFDTLGYIFTSTEMETPDGDPFQRSNGTDNISVQQDHISSAGEDAHEDDSSPDSDHKSSDDDVELAEQDSESWDTLSAQNEKMDLPECSSIEKSNNAVPGGFTSSSTPAEAMEAPSGSPTNHHKGYKLGSQGGPRVTFSPVENIKDINKSPPYFSMLKRSSLKPSGQSTFGDSNSSDDDQVKVIKGDSECRDTRSALNEKLGLRRLSISLPKRRLPDGLLSPKEAEAQGDELLIADKRSSGSDRLHPGKRSKLANTQLAPRKTGMIPLAKEKSDDENIKDIKKSPPYFSMLKRSSLKPSGQSTFGDSDSSDDDQVKVIKGDSECRDTRSALNEKLGLRHLSISLHKRRLPDGLLSPKEAEALGDELLIADKRSSGSDRLHLGKRSKPANTQLAPRKTGMIPLAEEKSDDENIKDINKSPPYFSMLKRSSLKPSGQSTFGDSDSSDDDQVKVIKGDSECRDTRSALNEKLGLRRLSISLHKRRLPDGLLSPKEAEALGDELLIADKRSSGSDRLHLGKRSKPANTQL